jgi:hypothetical protein
MEQSFLEARVGVEAHADVPAGYTALPRVVENLGYPVQVLAVSNKAVQPEFDPDGDGFPSLDGLGANDFLVWVLAGDYAYDGGATELTGPDGGAAIQQRPFVEAEAGGPLSAADSGFAFRRKGYAWWRRVNLSAHHYIVAYAFVGGGPLADRPAAPAALAKLFETLRFRDYS